MKDVFDLILNESLDNFMNYYKVVDDKEVYSNGTEFVPIFRVKQWYEYNNKDKEIEKLKSIIKEVREYLESIETDYAISCWNKEEDEFIDVKKDILNILDKENK